MCGLPDVVHYWSYWLVLWKLRDWKQLESHSLVDFCCGSDCFNAAFPLSGSKTCKCSDHTRILLTLQEAVFYSYHVKI